MFILFSCAFSRYNRKTNFAAFKSAWRCIRSDKNIINIDDLKIDYDPLKQESLDTSIKENYETKDIFDNNNKNERKEKVKLAICTATIELSETELQ